MTTEQKEAVKDLVEFNNKFDCGKYRKAIDTLLQRTSDNIIKNSNYYKKEGYYNNLKD